MLIVLSALLAGCAPEVEPAPEEATTPAVRDTGWTVDVGEVATPEWTAEEAAEAMQAALAVEMPIAQDVVDVFVEYMDAGTDICPGPDRFLDDVAGCTATTGYSYAGIAGYIGGISENPDSTLDQATIYGDFEIFSPEGVRFALGGAVSYVHNTQSSGELFYTASIRGTTECEGANVSFAEGTSALLDVSAAYVRGAPSVRLDGGIGWAGQHLAFEDLAVQSEECPSASTGVLELRSPSGHWYVLSFDEACTGCGEMSFDGITPLGEVCVDLMSFAESYVANAVSGS